MQSGVANPHRKRVGHARLEIMWFYPKTYMQWLILAQPIPKVSLILHDMEKEGGNGRFVELRLRCYLCVLQKLLPLLHFYRETEVCKCITGCILHWVSRA